MKKYRNLYDWGLFELLHLYTYLLQGNVNPIATDRIKWPNQGEGNNM